MAHKSAPVRFGSIKPKPPFVGSRQRIGLLGGSFNPPHEAHRLISQTSLRRLGLDAIWWIVTPGNPLKSHDELAPLNKRLRQCSEMVAGDPRVKITAFEQDLPSAFTAATLEHLRLRHRAVNFVWLMGADNLATFHLWQQWRVIASLMPIAVVDRPNWRLAAMASPAARYLEHRFVSENNARALPLMAPPAWTFLTGRLSDLSSTFIRQAHQTMNR